MTSHTISITAFLVAAIIGTMAITAAFSYANLVKASAPSGLPATTATSSNPLVAPNVATLLFATTTGGGCTARVISTASTTLMLTFGDTVMGGPTGTYGVWQAASTTVAYDSGLYGCGAVRGMANVGGQITVIETR